MPRVIDPSWTFVEGQEGLYLEQYDKVINGTIYTFRKLHSAEGYCFYNNTWAEEERIYWQNMSIGFTDDTANYTSIPVSELPKGTEIA